MRTPEVLRKGKWDDKAKLGILVGYNNDSYRVLINDRIINARHVKVIENEAELICLERTDENKDESVNTKFEIESINENDIENQNDNASETESEVESEVENKIVNDENDNNSVEKRTSNRIKKPVERYGNPVTRFIYVNFIMLIHLVLLKRR